MKQKPKHNRTILSPDEVKKIVQSGQAIDLEIKTEIPINSKESIILLVYWRHERQRYLAHVLHPKSKRTAVKVLDDQLYHYVCRRIQVIIGVTDVSGIISESMFRSQQQTAHSIAPQII